MCRTLKLIPSLFSVILVFGGYTQSGAFFSRVGDMGSAAVCEDALERSKVANRHSSWEALTLACVDNPEEALALLSLFVEQNSNKDAI